MLPSEMLRLTCGNARQRIQAINSKGFEDEDFPFRMVKYANVAIAKACYAENLIATPLYRGGRFAFIDFAGVPCRHDILGDTCPAPEGRYIPDASLYPLEWLIQGGH